MDIRGSDFLERQVQAYNESSRFADDIKYQRPNSIKVPSSLMNALFDPVMDKIIGKIGQMLRQDACQDCQYIFLVGGFGESKVLLKRVKEQFERTGGPSPCVVAQPDGTATAVMMGAVALCNDPALISTRVARYTYGFKIDLVAPPGTHVSHPKAKTKLYGDTTVIENVIMRIAEKGESIMSDVPRILDMEAHLKPPVDHQDGAEINFDIYYMDEDSPEVFPHLGHQWLYIDDNTPKLEGLKIRYSRNDRVKCTMHFGTACITATVYNETTGIQRNHDFAEDGL